MEPTQQTFINKRNVTCLKGHIPKLPNTGTQKTCFRDPIKMKPYNTYYNENSSRNCILL
ncbi:hypothetical protein Hanom_Chr02g00115981 [Helianthus anomalus]